MEPSALSFNLHKRNYLYQMILVAMLEPRASVAIANHSQQWLCGFEWGMDDKRLTFMRTEGRWTDTRFEFRRGLHFGDGNIAINHEIHTSSISYYIHIIIYHIDLFQRAGCAAYGYIPQEYSIASHLWNSEVRQTFLKRDTLESKMH